MRKNTLSVLLGIALFAWFEYVETDLINISNEALEWIITLCLIFSLIILVESKIIK